MRGRLKTLIGVPNRRSPKATQLSLKIDLWYQELHLYERWTWDRYVKLATAMSLTPEELESLIGVPHSYLGRYRKYGKVLDKPAALVLTMLEAHFFRDILKDVIEHPFPDLNKI
jgi:hypothetical protein